MPTSCPFRFCAEDAFEVKTSQSKCEAIRPRSREIFSREPFVLPVCAVALLPTFGVFGPVLAPPCIRHRVNGGAKSPNEQVQRDRLKQLLGD